MRLPGAVSRLAAPFFGSQAEPSSRQRGMFRAIGGVCLAFGEIHLSYIRVVASLLLLVWPMHGVILIFARVLAKPITLHSSSMTVGSCIFANGITHVAKFS